MNLTNECANGPLTEESTSFSHYFIEEGKYDQYNYSESNINETLLLQATLLESKKDLDKLKTPLLRQLKQQLGTISRQKSLVFDLCADLSITQSQVSNSKEDLQEKSNQKIQDLYHICRTLVDTLSVLENKVQKMEEKDTRTKPSERDLSGISIEKEGQSRLTYSSLRDSKGCRCQSQINQQSILSGLFQALQSKQKSQPYKEENQQLKKQIIRLEIANEQLRKNAKRSQTENHKLRQLLKQYQNFNKRLFTQKQVEENSPISRKTSQKMLSQRHFGDNKINNNSFFEDYKDSDKYLPREYYNNFSNFDQPVNSAQYIAQTSRPKYYKHVLETPSSGLKKSHIHTSEDRRKSFNPPSTFQAKAFNQQKNNKRNSDFPTTTSGIKITTFEQCKVSQKAMSTNSPFTRKGNNNILRPLVIDSNGMSFRDLKYDKMKHTNY